MIRTEYRYETQKRDRLLVVRLFGEIDHHSAAGLRAELDELLLKERPARLVLELSHVEFMDSAGLGLLMGRLRLVKQLGGVMALKGANARVLKILTLAGMERFMEIDGLKGAEK
ncbi:MAG: STAS domain-containing protein [Ruminococcaceae bacterium]|nr:STAS domain-containing protein [Oscillospiraceae bacterium]